MPAAAFRDIDPDDKQDFTGATGSGSPRGRTSFTRLPASTWCSCSRSRLPQSPSRTRRQIYTTQFRGEPRTPPAREKGERQDAARDRRGSQASRRRDWSHRRAAYLGRPLAYHPHTHGIVPGRGLALDSSRRSPADPAAPCRQCAGVPTTRFFSARDPAALLSWLRHGCPVRRNWRRRLLAIVRKAIRLVTIAYATSACPDCLFHVVSCCM